MRDRRFIAQHRGGPLPMTQHQHLARWAADCAERVLPLFEAVANDARVAAALAAAREWSSGGVAVGVGLRAAWAAHAAARSTTDPAAIAAARAAGHAAATAHAADHSLGGAHYACRALIAAGRDPHAERRWQIDHAPRAIRALVRSALNGPRFALEAPRAANKR